MEVKNYYIENGLAMLNMQTDYKAEEEWGVSDLIKKKSGWGNAVSIDYIFI